MQEKFSCCFDFVLQFEIHFFRRLLYLQWIRPRLNLGFFYHTGIYLTTLIIVVFDRPFQATFKLILKIFEKLSNVRGIKQPWIKQKTFPGMGGIFTFPIVFVC
jgi:hypothetical protein